MQKIIPTLWFQGNAEAAGKFYASAFTEVGGPGFASSTVEGRYPEEGLMDFQKEFAGAALTVDVQVAGTHFTLLNAGDNYTPNPSISFMLNFDPLMFGDASTGGDEAQARERLSDLWHALLDGGTPCSMVARR